MNTTLKNTIIGTSITGVFALSAIYLKSRLEPSNQLSDEQIEVITKKDGSSHKIEKRRYK